MISTFSVYRTAVQARWLTAAVSPSQFPPPEPPEFAFLGRSNVGKSSLLNALAAARVARTSKTPGRTQTLHFFEVRGPQGILRLTDLPGYGYARVPTEVSRAIERAVTAYFRAARADVLLLLVDVRRQVDEEDLQACEWARHGRSVPVWVVGTKADKVSKSARFPTRLSLAQQLGVDVQDVLLTSSLKTDGIEALRQRMWGQVRGAD